MTVFSATKMLKSVAVVRLVMETGGYSVRDLKTLSKSVEYLMENSKELAKQAIKATDQYDPSYLKKVNSILEKRKSGQQKLYKVMRTGRVNLEQQVIAGKELSEGSMYAKMAVGRIEEKLALK